MTNFAAWTSAGVPLPVFQPFFEANTWRKVDVVYFVEPIGGRKILYCASRTSLGTLYSTILIGEIWSRI